MDTPTPARRRLLLVAAAGATAATLGLPVRAQGAAVVLPRMTEGPFYPDPDWRAVRTDWDADLTLLAESSARRARGEHLALALVVADVRGRPVDGAELEIWQCDALGAYRHQAVSLEPGRHDPAFQGFGAARTGRDGAVHFRTIRPAPYPGRTPHIHLRVRHPTIGELTSQLFVDGDPGNARDGLWRRLGDRERAALAMQLQPAPSADGLRWQARHAIVVPA